MSQFNFHSYSLKGGSDNLWCFMFQRDWLGCQYIRVCDPVWVGWLIRANVSVYSHMNKEVLPSHTATWHDLLSSCLKHLKYITYSHYGAPMCTPLSFFLPPPLHPNSSHRNLQLEWVIRLLGEEEGLSVDTLMLNNAAHSHWSHGP